MALEVTTYIDGLVPTNPPGSDPVAQADDHLRLIKQTLKNTFPNVAGEISLTHAQLNDALQKAGGTMTGALILHTSAPTENLQAASKGYVDSKVAASSGGMVDPGLNGILVRTDTNVTTAKTLTAGAGIEVTNGNGVAAGNPTIINKGVLKVNNVLPDVNGNVAVAATPSTGSVTGDMLSGQQTGSAPVFGARAWVNFNGSGAVGSQSIRASGNVSSVTKTASGVYEINFSVSMPDANYAIIGSAMGAQEPILVWRDSLTDTQTASKAIIRTADSNNPGTSVDPTHVWIAFFR